MTSPSKLPKNVNFIIPKGVKPADWYDKHKNHKESP